MTKEETNLLYNAYAFIANNTSGLTKLQMSYEKVASLEKVDEDVLEVSKPIYLLLKSAIIIDDAIHQLKAEGKIDWLKED